MATQLPRRMGFIRCRTTGKRRYRNYFEATAAARDIRDQTGDDHGRPYACASCEGWHLGRSATA